MVLTVSAYSPIMRVQFLRFNNKYMKKSDSIILFNQKQVRRIWDEEKELWYFSVIDVVQVLTDSSNPNGYWYRLKVRVGSEDGFQLSTICRQLKLLLSDGKKYKTNCTNTDSH